jgi:hypothetical protein
MNGNEYGLLLSNDSILDCVSNNDFLVHLLNPDNLGDMVDVLMVMVSVFFPFYHSFLTMMEGKVIRMKRPHSRNLIPETEQAELLSACQSKVADDIIEMAIFMQEFAVPLSWIVFQASRGNLAAYDQKLFEDQPAVLATFSKDFAAVMNKIPRLNPEAFASVHANEWIQDYPSLERSLGYGIIACHLIKSTLSDYPDLLSGGPLTNMPSPEIEKFKLRNSETLGYQSMFLHYSKMCPKTELLADEARLLWEHDSKLAVENRIQGLGDIQRVLTDNVAKCLEGDNIWDAK